jgi:predicted nucleic acid-binding protein
VTPLKLSYPILERYADLRRALRPPHGPGLIGDVDTLIAVTALEHRLTVVTTDEDCTRVPGLAVMHLQRAALL